MIIVIGDVERVAAHGYAYREVKLRGGAHTAGMPRRTTAGDRADGLVRKVDRPDAVVAGIGDVEGASAYG